MKIGIVGKKKDTGNYEAFMRNHQIEYLTSLSISELGSCDSLLFPGGGDITPAFFGELDRGSRSIDTELDILQLQALEYGVQRGIPILGICKGMQIINVGLGGSIIQDLPTAGIHRYQGADQYHEAVNLPDSFIAELYGETMVVNSAHHQGLGKLGKGLRIVSRCPLDQCVEAVCHESLPIIGVQWHPERLDPLRTSVSGSALLHYFLSLGG
ncbi:MAG: gamma-glutamyl-gamma-aminobutyrate hydrolase family protein [bacterium]|nr:gamma-glutamyl-gamma-aminobutyrate hydrolase family protein [bacterium]MCM1374986.1 gamma-glutamyl-gamma-aminobutyrate hydrolase family protein [Muribaculum sp.]